MSTQDSSANAMEMMSEATEAAAGMLPSDMIHAIAELVDPATVAREMPWLAGELTKIALGQSDIISMALAELSCVLMTYSRCTVRGKAGT